MAQQVKVLAAMSDDLSSIPGMYMLEREIIPSNCAMFCTHAQALHMCEHQYTYTTV